MSGGAEPRPEVRQACTVGAGAPAGSRRRRRRWPWFVVAAAVFLASVAALGWFAWLPQYRPSLRPGEQYGVDVSSHQGDVDWDRVARDDIGFAYLKATEGGDFTDDQFQRNWDGAAQARIRRGAYHFFTLCRPGADQARHFLRVVPRDADALAPAIDLELAGNCRGRPDRASVQHEVETFIALVEAEAGLPVVLYLGADFERAYRLRAALDRPLWHRRPLRRPDIAGWTVWQVHNYARVDGIDGRVDLDIGRDLR